jgi:NAD(P)-dependent dehydrogenase (short-subunit alcohol dehydrogenase family)
VLLVGGAGGIGDATATAVARRGATVAIADREGDAARRVADRLAELGGRALAVPCDILNAGSVDAMVEQVVETLGGIDVIVNCAGVVAPEPSAELTDAGWSDVTDVHVLGTLRCLRAAFPALRRSPSAAVVNLSSMNAQLGVSGRLSYCAAKGAVEAMTRVLAVEWAPHGIRVNAIAPGYVETSMLRGMIERGEHDEGRLLARVPLGRLAHPDEIASVISFLASRDASYLTGQTIVVDGGRVVNGDL